MTHEVPELAGQELIDPINWNDAPAADPLSLEIWNKLIAQFWVPEKIAVSNDLPSWGTLTEAEQRATSQVFAGLTLLDTVQSFAGAPSLMKDAKSPFEEAVYANITFMEAVHAKSYSNIFSTLLSTTEIREVFRWAKENTYLKNKQAIVLKHYHGADPEKKKIASTLLESFLFYSGFFMPLWWSSKAKLTNTADILRLIIRDESIHGYFIGAKFQEAYKVATPERQAELKDFLDELAHELFENEMRYTADLYDELGLTEQVKAFLKYNLNKAYQNLSFEAPYPGAQKEVPPAILAALNPSGEENHDFFSGSGSSYLIGKAEETTEDDWDF
jgi:ribonucleoside-diphosphate reductase beta chain